MFFECPTIISCGARTIDGNAVDGSLADLRVIHKFRAPPQKKLSRLRLVVYIIYIYIYSDDRTLQIYNRVDTERFSNTVTTEIRTETDEQRRQLLLP